MTVRVDPGLFGLPSRTVVEERGENIFVIVMHRKSRIIMADAKKILARAEAIRSIRPGARVSLATTAPVCSKSEKFLAEQGIDLC